MINVNPPELGAQPSNNVTVSGREHMVRIMTMVAREHQEKCPFAASDVLEEPKKFRFRHFSHKFTEAGVIGQISENRFYNMCRAAIFERMDFTTRVDKNGEWAVVAWEIASGKGRIQGRGPYQGPRDWDRFKHDPSHYGAGAPSPQQTQYEWQEVDNLVFTYCVVDTLQNEELDVMMENMGRKDVTMVKFLETGEHKYLPPPLRKQREMALKLVRVFVKGGESATDVDLDSSQYRQVQALRNAGEKWRDIAPLFNVSWTALRKAYSASEVLENANVGPHGVGQA